MCNNIWENYCTCIMYYKTSFLTIAKLKMSFRKKSRLNFQVNSALSCFLDCSSCFWYLSCLILCFDYRTIGFALLPLLVTMFFPHCFLTLESLSEIASLPRGSGKVCVHFHWVCCCWRRSKLFFIKLLLHKFPVFQWELIYEVVALLLFIYWFVENNMQKVIWIKFMLVPFYLWWIY